MVQIDPLEGLYEIAPKVSGARLEKLITRAFEGSSEGRKCAEACTKPAAFNMLLGWVPGDERWPVAALLLRRGLTIRGSAESTYNEIAGLVNRSTNSVSMAVNARGTKSVYRKIATAWELMGDNPQPNELRFDLKLPSPLWTALARRRIRTIDALERAIKDESVYRVPGIGRETIARVAIELKDLR